MGGLTALVGKGLFVERRSHSMWRPGPLEIGIIAAVVIILFGVGKLPQVGGALGKAIRDFRKGVKFEDEDASPSEGAGSGRDAGVSTKRNDGT